MTRQKRLSGKHLLLSDQKINDSFSENALKMMKKRYFLVDDSGNRETPVQIFRRVAQALAEVEKKYSHDDDLTAKVEKDFFEIMARKEFTPAGRTLTNAGGPTPLIANCIVLPIHDSMESIFQTLKDASLLQQAGSGLGFAIDEMRPAMAPTKKSRGSSSGPVSFLKVYNEAFSTIKQQGRHGANMAMMGIDHPDVLDFIRSKELEGEIRNFNISVKITDEFMRQLIERPDTQWYCVWNGEKVKPRRVLRHSNGSVYGTKELDITVGEIFDELVHYAWLNGEPGIVFIDTVNQKNPLPGLGPIQCSNPCAEQFLHPYDNCNLGSVNLAVFAKNKQIDYRRLKLTVKTAVRLLDNVIDKFNFPVEVINEMARKNRRIGLGIMGFADLLYQLGIRYDSEEGYAMAEKVMAAVQKAAADASSALAKEKGVFPNQHLSIFAPQKISRRNAALTTIAPTGSISMMFDTSSGIEPNFALTYVKQDKDGSQYHYLNKYFEAELRRRKFDKATIEKIQEEIIKTGSIQNLKDLPYDLRETFVVAMDMAGEDHIRMQAAFQKHVDNSISKTINFPNNATEEDVRKSFILAWRLKCKSCAVYRNGSRHVQILNLGTGENIDSTAEITSRNKRALMEIERSRLSPRVRPPVMVGKTYKVKTGYGNLYITVNNDDRGEPFEVFATIGKTGGFFQEQSEGICRLISLGLRAGIKVEDIVDNLKGIRGPMPTFTDKGTILSLPDAIGKILEEHAKSRDSLKTEIKPVEEVIAAPAEPQTVDAQTLLEPVTVQLVSSPNVEKSMADYGVMPGCPDCGDVLQLSEGCLSCKSCGFSRCT